ncbi:hypothetical protein B0T21DRAFT_203277 [Apiosordaria backusii]|uniref:Uncharacterized protein n=1 Tax=Apiosordaria backusii TaxID=314023 RepID=A0AA40BER3_9PEZI|nr:hypothetical protein B0T21DRAFT_203277 [Apiosordaria backusii]
MRSEGCGKLHQRSDPTPHAVVHLACLYAHTQLNIATTLLGLCFSIASNVGSQGGGPSPRQRMHTRRSSSIPLNNFVSRGTVKQCPCSLPGYYGSTASEIDDDRNFMPGRRHSTALHSWRWMIARVPRRGRSWPHSRVDPARGRHHRHPSLCLIRTRRGGNVETRLLISPPPPSPNNTRDDGSQHAGRDSGLLLFLGLFRFSRLYPV